MRPDGAFTVLLLISSVTALTESLKLVRPVLGNHAVWNVEEQPELVFVPPPTNVTVSCRNLRVLVNWEFSDQQPHTSFRVETKNSDGELKTETTEHQYDLTGFIWESQNQFMNFHYVRVTALQNGVESDPVQSESFTFNKGKTADKHCLLDFPPVEVVAGDSGNIVSFPNPFHFYTELKKAKGKESAFFKFNISSDQGNYTDKCSWTQSVCRFDLPPSKETCVRVGGWLDDGNSVEKVEFNQTELICPSKTSDAHVFTFVFLLIALVLIISGLAVSIYKVKAWTLKTQQDLEETQALNFQPNNEDPQVLREVEEAFSPVMVIESSSCSEVSSEDCSAYLMEEGRSERGRLEEPEDQEPEDQEPAAVGNYDRGHVHLDVRVDLGDGDMADAYREG